jgi:hypothetical protein
MRASLLETYDTHYLEKGVSEVPSNESRKLKQLHAGHGRPGFQTNKPGQSSQTHMDFH